MRSFSIDEGRSCKRQEYRGEGSFHENEGFMALKSSGMSGINPCIDILLSMDMADAESDETCINMALETADL